MKGIKGKEWGKGWGWGGGGGWVGRENDRTEREQERGIKKICQCWTGTGKKSDETNGPSGTALLDEFQQTSWGQIVLHQRTTPVIKCHLLYIITQNPTQTHTFIKVLL